MDQVQQPEGGWSELLQQSECEHQRLEQELQQIQQRKADLWNDCLANMSNNTGIAARESATTILKTLIEGRKQICRIIKTSNRDKHEAHQLCTNLTSEKQLTEDIVRVIVTEFHQTHPTRALADILQALSGVPLSNNTADDIDDDDDDYRGSQRTGCATKNTKRTRSSDSDKTVPHRAKRTQHDYHTRQAYELSDSDTEEENNLIPRRTIDEKEVYGTDFIFQYPPGDPNPFIVIRCDRDAPCTGRMRRFITGSPLGGARAAFKHFSSSNPREKCHNVPENYEDEYIAKNFGYRVVDCNGQPITQARVKQSNAAIPTKGKAPDYQCGRPANKTVSSDTPPTAPDFAVHPPSPQPHAAAAEPAGPPPPLSLPPLSAHVGISTPTVPTTFFNAAPEPDMTATAADLEQSEIIYMGSSVHATNAQPQPDDYDVYFERVTSDILNEDQQYR